MRNSTTWELDKEIKHFDQGTNGNKIKVAHTWTPDRRRHKARRLSTESWKLRKALYT